VKENFQEKAAYFSFPFSDEGISASFFEAVADKVDLSFGITGINVQNDGRHLGRIDMEKNGGNAREIINKAFLKYRFSTSNARRFNRESGATAPKISPYRFSGTP
jgi:hypothetical protein